MLGRSQLPIAPCLCGRDAAHLDGDNEQSVRVGADACWEWSGRGAAHDPLAPGAGRHQSACAGDDQPEPAAGWADHACAAQGPSILVGAVRDGAAERDVAIGLHPLVAGRRTDVEVLNWLDDHSRCLLSCTVHRPVSGDDVVAVFLGLVEDTGRQPQR